MYKHNTHNASVHYLLHSLLITRDVLDVSINKLVMLLLHVVLPTVRQLMLRWQIKISIIIYIYNMKTENLDQWIQLTQIF